MIRPHNFNNRRDGLADRGRTRRRACVSRRGRRPWPGRAVGRSPSCRGTRAPVPPGHPRAPIFSMRRPPERSGQPPWDRVFVLGRFLTVPEPRTGLWKPRSAQSVRSVGSVGLSGPGHLHARARTFRRRARIGGARAPGQWPARAALLFSVSRTHGLHSPSRAAARSIVRTEFALV